MTQPDQSKAARLPELLRHFYVPDSEFVDDYEGGLPSDDVTVMVPLTRSQAAAIRAAIDQEDCHESPGP